VTRTVAAIKLGQAQELRLGNIDAKRDWGHARDYVRAMWMMLQQEQPQDFVIATGLQYSVREFIQWAAAELGITLRFEGEGVNEKAVVASVTGDKAPALQAGDCVVAVDPRYFRPTEVETLLGDPTKAKTELGWVPEITAQQMCTEMVTEDLKAAQQTALLRRHGFHTAVSREG
jgi:GDPmannose 4,6-dehydratase